MKMARALDDVQYRETIIVIGKGYQSPATLGKALCDRGIDKRLVTFGDVFLLAGADLRAVHRSAFMPGFCNAYTDQELAAVASYYFIAHFGAKSRHAEPDKCEPGEPRMNIDCGAAAFPVSTTPFEM
jgi:hypothetical protein